jgi:hypothetical protein
MSSDRVTPGRGCPPSGQTVAWSVVFFFASGAASSAYLTADEGSPGNALAKYRVVLRTWDRARGSVGPWLLGSLLGSDERRAIGGG